MASRFKCPHCQKFVNIDGGKPKKTKPKAETKPETKTEDTGPRPETREERERRIEKELWG